MSEAACFWCLSKALVCWVLGTDPDMYLFKHVFVRCWLTVCIGFFSLRSFIWLPLDFRCILLRLLGIWTVLFSTVLLLARCLLKPGLAAILECFMTFAYENFGAKLVNFYYDTAFCTNDCCPPTMFFTDLLPYLIWVIKWGGVLPRDNLPYSFC